MQLPQYWPANAPQQWVSYNGQQVMNEFSQEMHQHLPEDQIQGEWYPACRMVWVPVEEMAQTQHGSAPIYEYFNQHRPYEEYSAEVEPPVDQMEYMQSPLQIINQHGPYEDNDQAYVIWAPYEDSEYHSPDVSYHLPPNQQYGSYGMPCDPQMQGAQYQYELYEPSFDDQFQQQNAMDHDTYYQQDKFEQPAQILSCETSQQQYHLAYSSPYPVQTTCIQNYEPMTSPTDACTQEQYERQWEYVQPNDRYEVQQQQQVLYVAISGPPCEPDMKGQPYVTPTDPCTINQFYEQCSNAPHISMYSRNEEKPISAHNQALIQPVCSPPYHPHLQNAQCYMPNNETPVPNQYQHESTIQQQGVYIGAPVNQQTEVKTMQSTTAPIQNQLYPQSGAEFIPPQYDFHPYRSYEAPNLQYGIVPDRPFGLSGQEDYTFAPPCDQFQQQSQQYHLIEHSQFYQQSQVVTTVEPHRIQCQQDCIIFDPQVNARPVLVSYEVPTCNEQQQQQEITSIPTQRSSNCNQQHSIPRNQLTSQESSTYSEPSCGSYIQYQQSVMIKETSIEGQCVEKMRNSLAIICKHDQVQKIKTTCSLESVYCDSKLSGIYEMVSVKGSKEEVASNQERNELHHSRSCMGKEENKMVLDLTDSGNDSENR